MNDDSKIRRLLVADDDPNLRELLVLNLTAEGFEVQAYDNGEDACEQSGVMKPHLIVLDVMMPERDGISALRVLKEDPSTCHIPVVLLTARATMPKCGRDGRRVRTTTSPSPSTSTNSCTSSPTWVCEQELLLPSRGCHDRLGSPHRDTITIQTDVRPPGR